MNNERKIISEVFTNVLETMTFMFADSFDISLPAPQVNDAVQAYMEFCGEAGFGAVSITVPSEMTRDFACNILGMEIDDPMAADKTKDALKELLNVITGKIATEIFGTRPVFHLSIPNMLPVDNAYFEILWNGPAAFQFSIDGKPILLTCEIKRA